MTLPRFRESGEGAGKCPVTKSGTVVTADQTPSVSARRLRRITSAQSRSQGTPEVLL